MTSGVVTALANWLPTVATIVSVFGAFAGAWAAISTRRRYYDEYKRRKRK